MAMRLEGVRELREAAGWSRADLAARAGVRESVIARAEKGGPVRNKPAKRIAAALSVAVETLMVIQGIDTLATEVADNLDPRDDLTLGDLAASIAAVLDPEDEDESRGE